MVLFSFTNTNVAIFDIVISYFVSDTNQVEIKITISIVEYEIYLQFVLWLNFIGLGGEGYGV